MTEEQLAFGAAVREHRVVSLEAVAGAGKTTAIKHAIPDRESTLCVAFNRKAAADLLKTFENAKCMTLNSLGHRLWGNTIGRRCVVDEGKMRAIDSAVAGYARWIKQMGIPPGEVRMADLQLGWVMCGFLQKPDKLVLERTRKALERSIALARQGTLDFDDQLYMPSLFPCATMPCEMVVVDEAQDLSPVQVQLVTKLLLDRLVVVGDPRQQIYQFRGAISSPMADLVAAGCEEFGVEPKLCRLTESFRVPVEICEVVHELFGITMRSRKHGTIERIQWDEIPEWAQGKCAVLGRTNKILAECGRLLLAHEIPHRLGRQTGRSLVNTLRAMHPDWMSLTSSQLRPLLTGLMNTAMALIEEGNEAAGATLMDRIEAVQILLNTFADGASIARYLRESGSGPELLTIHTAKGLEWDRVVLLRPLKFFAQSEAEANVHYVALTRAKKELITVEDGEE